MEVSTIIVKQKDLGCNAAKCHIMDQDKEITDAQSKLFWKTLGGKAEVTGIMVIIIIPAQRACKSPDTKKTL